MLLNLSNLGLAGVGFSFTEYEKQEVSKMISFFNSNGAIFKQLDVHEFEYGADGF